MGIPEKSQDLSNSKKEVQKNLQEYDGVLKQYYIATKQYEKALEVQDHIISVYHPNDKSFIEDVLNRAAIYYEMVIKSLTDCTGITNMFIALILSY